MADRLDLEQLRTAMDYGWKDWHYGDSLHDTDLGALDTILGAARWLLSLAESGSRLVAEAPCEHGIHDAHPFPDKRIGDFPYCPGGSRRRVFPKEGER
jgi:hypothetical protein